MLHQAPSSIQSGRGGTVIRLCQCADFKTCRSVACIAGPGLLLPPLARVSCSCGVCAVSAPPLVHRHARPPQQERSQRSVCVSLSLCVCCSAPTHAFAWVASAAPACPKSWELAIWDCAADHGPRRPAQRAVDPGIA